MHSEFHAEDQLAQALRDGLQAQPTPAISPDFDACVLAALRQPAPWHQRFWQAGRPVLLSAAASLPVMLLLMHWTLTAPLTPPVAAAPTLAAVPANLPSLDALLDRPNLCEATLEQAWAAPAPLPPDRRAEPRRHASLAPVPPTIA